MNEKQGTGRGFGKNILYLFISLIITGAASIVLPFQESPEPGTLPRAVLVIIFFSVYTILFLWEIGYLKR